MAKKSRTRAARERRQKEQRRNQQRLIIVGIVIVAILAIGLFAVSTQPTEAFIPQDLAEKYDGLQRSSSIEGYPRLGDPDAPVVVEEYSSFSCPGCEGFHATSLSAILDRVRTGQVLFTYIPLQTGSIPNAEGSARAALCAGQQGQFWEMHDMLFDWHTRYGNTAFSQSRFMAGVDGLGMNADSFLSCFNSAPITETLNNAIEEGVGRTPTIAVNGVTLTPEQAGGIPTTPEILRAIDNATPSDWRPSADDVEEPEDAEAEETPEAEAQADETTDADVEATAEPEADEASETDAEESAESDMDENTETDSEEMSESDADVATDSDADEMADSDTEEETTESDAEETTDVEAEETPETDSGD